MNREEFEKLHFGRFEMSENDQLLYDIGKEYNLHCDAYDNYVCSGFSKIDNCPIPACSGELNLVNKFATEMRRQIMDKYQIDYATLSKAVKFYNKCNR